MRFFCPGLAVTEGSIKCVGRRRNGSAILRHDRADELEVWRSTVALAAREAGVTYFREAPVSVDLLFVLERPKSHYGVRGLRRWAPALPIAERSGDVDKLERAVLDALTGIAYRTDAQVTDGGRRKRYAAQGSPSGVFVAIDPVDSEGEVEIRHIRGSTFAEIPVHEDPNVDRELSR